MISVHDNYFMASGTFIYFIWGIIYNGKTGFLDSLYLFSLVGLGVIYLVNRYISYVYTSSEGEGEDAGEDAG
jgi:hypothetical protein